jgi:plastocyanin
VAVAPVEGRRRIRLVVPMRSRTDRHRPPARTRPLRVLLTLLALLPVLVLPAHAAGEPQDPGALPPEPRIEIFTPGSDQPRVVLYSSLSGQINRRMTLPGQSEPTEITGFSLNDVLRKAHVADTSYSSLTTLKADNTVLEILSFQVRSPSGEVPLVFLDGDGVLSLVRPSSQADPTGPELASAPGGTLTLRMASEAKMLAAPETVSVGTPITFQVTLPSGVEANATEYEWNFNDDGDIVRNRNATMQHTFKRAGDYTVIVNYYVNGTLYSSSSFLAPTATVTVRPLRRRSTERGARNASDRRRRASDDGGDGTGGGSGDGSGGAGTGGSGTGGGGTGGWTPPASTPAATPPPATPRPERKRRAPKPVRQAPAGETVDGYLLASADAPLPTGGAVRAVEPTPVVERKRNGPLEIPALAWVAVGLLGLVVLGWTLESRTTLPYFKP